MADRETARLTADVVRLTADVVLFAVDGPLRVLLIRRALDHDTFPGYWALPGGHVDPNENTDDAARRELAEETGLTVNDLTKVDVYATPGRDPRGRYVTFAYTTALGEVVAPTAGDDATDARWWLVDDLDEDMLAFDHWRIVRDALDLGRWAR